MTLTLNIVLLCAVGAALYALVRTFRDRPGGKIVLAGFLLRAFAALGAFWISYLGLPIGRSLQLGNGLWFYALDGQGYYAQAVVASRESILGILAPSSTDLSSFYMKLLALGVMALGESAFVGVILNLFAYLGTCWVISIWPRGGKLGRAAETIALVGMSFSPTLVLWSTQPLKDCVAIFLIVAWSYALFALVCRWSEFDIPRRALHFLTLAVAIYVLAGIRWYLSFVLLAVALLPAVVVPLARAPISAMAAIRNVAILYLLLQCLLTGAGPNLPPALKRALTPSTAREAGFQQPVVLLASFGSTGGEAGTEPTAGSTAEPSPAATSTIEKRSVLKEWMSLKDGVFWKMKLAHLDFRATTAGSTIRAGKLTGDGDESHTLTPRICSLFVPVSIGNRIGLFQIKTGRSPALLVLPDTDTVFFVAMLVLATGAIIRHRREIRLNTEFVYLFLCLLAIAGPIIYVINNLGTLVRHRGMFLTLILLLLLSLAPPIPPDLKIEEQPPNQE